MENTNDLKARAGNLLRGFKGERYTFGLDCFGQLGDLAASLGRRAAVVVGGTGKSWGPKLHERVKESLRAAGMQIAGELIPGARPNAPVEDVRRIAAALSERKPEVVVAVGGGSLIDATKAAAVLATLGEKGPGLEACYGSGKITAMLRESGARLFPLVAVQTASGSAAHLTKYANVTDLAAARKNLIIDEAIVPPRALFDYTLTTTMSCSFTCDGALDGVAHALEVFYGVRGDALARVRPVSLTAIELIVSNLRAACNQPDDSAVREALGLGTDLGGCAIMIGQTNGGHLTSFSLVDILPHGRACALMNPYYTVFFAPAIEPQLREVGAILRSAGLLKGEPDRLRGRDLGLAVAEGLIELSRSIGFPTKLSDVEGFSAAHIARALKAAGEPQYAAKIQNMPVPLSADMVDEYMGRVLEAARTGAFSIIRSI